MSTIAEAYQRFREQMPLPAVNAWNWPGGPITLGEDDAGCTLFRHARGFKKRRLRAALKGRRPTKYSPA